MKSFIKIYESHSKKDQRVLIDCIAISLLSFLTTLFIVFCILHGLLWSDEYTAWMWYVSWRNVAEDCAQSTCPLSMHSSIRLSIGGTKQVPQRFVPFEWKANANTPIFQIKCSHRFRTASARIPSEWGQKRTECVCKCRSTMCSK